MFKLTIEVDNRTITQTLESFEGYNESRQTLQTAIADNRTWITLFDTNYGTVLLSSEHLRRAFIKYEEVPCE